MKASDGDVSGLLFHVNHDFASDFEAFNAPYDVMRPDSIDPIQQ